MRKKTGILIGALIIFVISAAGISYIEYQSTIACSTWSAQEAARVEQAKIYKKDLETQLLYNDYEVPYDRAEKTYYFPVARDTNLQELKFQTADSTQKIYWIADEMWDNPEMAVSEGHAFTLYVISGDTYTAKQMIFTGLPMLSVQRTAEGEQDPANCRIDLFDPFHSSEGVYEICESPAFFELRGQTSLRFPKKNYNLELYTQKGKENKQSLLGMRSDDDWKLNALYTDGSRVREAVVNTLWNEIAETTESDYDTGSRMEYVELLIDGEYLGLYGVMEPVDFKQLNLNRQEDVLYKGVSFITEENSTEDFFDQRGDYSGQKIKTGNQSVTGALWKPMREYLSTLQFDFTGNLLCDPEDLYEYVNTHMNLENLLNYELFIQAIYGEDNAYKNQYIVSDINDHGEYQLWKIPWDLNYCFGDCYNGETELLAEFSWDTSCMLMKDYMLTEHLRAAEIPEFTTALRERWESLRETVLAVEHVRQLTKTYSHQLAASGAFLREMKKWPESTQSDSEHEIWEYFGARMRYLDSCYEP